MRRAPVVSTVGLLSIVFAGCGVGRGAGRPEPAPFGAEPRVVEVQNGNLERISVTLDVGGSRYFLGTVDPAGVAQFAVPTEAVGSIARIVLQPAAEGMFRDTRATGRRITLGPVAFLGAEMIRLVIAPDVVHSILESID